ncbi:MAG: porphobilinogen synthase, partial [Planctomycetes bacterium]|nr:porphobilinogen synthase [Planctomycetota bacterium]
MESFPRTRMRRLRENPVLREMTAETALSMKDLIHPLFVVEGRGVDQPIGAMPGVSRLSPDRAVAECGEVLKLGVRAVILFGIPPRKDERGDEGLKADGVVQQSVRAIKKAFGGDLAVVTDVCLCEYTSHGHCGFLKDGRVDNDPTLAQLAGMAVSHAAAGADMVAPSDMMDGRVGAIRDALDR